MLKSDSFNDLSVSLHRATLLNCSVGVQVIRVCSFPARNTALM